jgi:hypothetical protein
MVFPFLYLACLQPIIMSNNLPSSIIDQALANQRRALFMDKKKAVLDALIGYKKELDHLNYSASVFLELLKFLVKEKGHYSGLRVYFASQRWSENDPCSRYIASNEEENLTLIFVPTIAIGQNGNTIHRDDLDHCFLISHNRLIRLPRPGEVEPFLDTASNWVRHYRTKIPALSVNGELVTGNGAFRETHCNWYKIGIFLDNPATPETPATPGLISYMEKLQSDQVNPLVAIRPQFACYTETDTYTDIPLHYQLTLLFELRQKNDPDPNPNPVIWSTKHHADDEKRAEMANANGGANRPAATLAAVAAPQAAVAEAAVAEGASNEATPDDADTGYPCPPALTCNGSQLPA